MFKSEPKSIVQFLATHFDLLRQLFDIQVKNEIILKSQVAETLDEFGSDIESQLFEHKILVEQNDDFVINEPYFVLFEFVLQQFKPLLPEEIEKFGQSIRTLFLNIKEGINQDKNILLDRIEALSNEIKKFRTAVTNNQINFLKKTRELKTKPRKIEKQKLYNRLRQVVKDISQQSTILSNELLPLLDRIRTESEYLLGFHLYLTNMNCYKGIKPPKLFSTSRDNLYNPFIYENTKEYFEQFKNEEDVFVEEEANDIAQWIFNKNEYKSQLNSKLPVTDFLSWCKNAIENEKKDFDIDNYFMVTSLIFEE